MFDNNFYSHFIVINSRKKFFSKILKFKNKNKNKSTHTANIQLFFGFVFS